jgi:hypothetical protein
VNIRVGFRLPIQGKKLATGPARDRAPVRSRGYANLSSVLDTLLVSRGANSAVFTGAAEQKDRQTTHKGETRDTESACRTLAVLVKIPPPE